MVRNTNCRFDTPGSILNLATLFLFCIKLATEFFALKIEQLLKRLTLSWKFVSDQKLIQEETKSNMSSKYMSVYGSHTNGHCEMIQHEEIETLVLNAPKNPYLNQATH